VGLRRGARRRTSGRRREEVAELCDMSTDYFARLERSSGSQPSQQMITAIARVLRLTPDERDHLFQLAGHRQPAQQLRDSHVSPGLMRVIADRIICDRALFHLDADLRWLEHTATLLDDLAEQVRR
jgi:transcriptional regulator with XRE-family HTH domain